MADEAAPAEPEIKTETLPHDLAAPGSIGAEPPAEPETPGAEAQDGTQEATGEAPGAAEATDGQEPPEGDKSRDAAIEAMRRRISQLSAQRAQEAEHRRQMEAELAQYRQRPAPTDQQQDDPDTLRMVPEADVQRLVMSEAERIAAAKFEAQKFADDCNRVAEKGEAAFKDFKAVVVGALGTFAGDSYQEVIRAALDTDAPEKVLYELGKNLDEADRIMSLAPTRRVAEMQKIALKQPAPKPVSQVPRPITPVEGRAAPDGVLSDKMSDEDWFKARAKTAPVHLRY